LRGERVKGKGSRGKRAEDRKKMAVTGEVGEAWKTERDKEGNGG
jgi:hypothetical protein